jgi:hypothetical protein
MKNDNINFKEKNTAGPVSKDPRRILEGIAPMKWIYNQ